MSEQNGKGLSKKFVAGIVVLAVVLFFVIRQMACSALDTGKAWPTTGLAEKLPEPPGRIESIDMNEKQLRASIDRCSDAEYKAYIESCKDMGFTIDAEGSTEDFYRAYSKEGYLLDLSSYSSGEDFTITLDAPLEFSEIAWPTSGAGSLVPAPQSAKGIIDSDSSTFFFAYVGETSPDAFAQYADACSQAGFNVDYNRGDTFYQADNANGVSLSLDYRGYNTMTVRVDASNAGASNDTPVGQEAEAETDADAGAPISSESVSPDFKATMDEYEAFFDQYVEFMNAYNADSSSPELLARYADMMSQYSDMMNSLDKIDEESLSPADYAYYTEVMARISAKLAEVAQWQRCDSGGI